MMNSKVHSPARKKNSRGFTLVEMLAALIILIMLISVVGTGLNTALKVYKDLTFTSESDLLASTVHTAMSDILRYAVYEPDGNTAGAGGGTAGGGTSSADPDGYVRFSNETYGISKGFIFLQNNKFMVYLGDGTDIGKPDLSDPADKSYFYLVNPGGYTTMTIPDKADAPADGSFQITYDKGVFTGQYAIRDRTGTTTRTEHFAFRSLKTKRGG